MKELNIKSPINYIGNKYKIIKQIEENFPNNINMFVDVFGGSGNVTINTKAQYYLYNDINKYVKEIFEGFMCTSVDEILNNIYAIINKYKLDKQNRSGFELLRADYNNGKNDWITLYTLMCYSFNYQFRFNNNQEYNSSFGKNRSCFSDKQRDNLIQLKDKTKNFDISFMAKNFIDIDYSDFDNKDLIYFDPPYLNSIGNYNDGKRGFEGWNMSHEIKLLNLLDLLDKQGTRFALSNNLKYENELLKIWKEKYNTIFLNADYSNCNYQKIDKTKDIEVLITNYSKDKN